MPGGNASVPVLVNRWGRRLSRRGTVRSDSRRGETRRRVWTVGCAPAAGAADGLSTVIVRGAEVPVTPPRSLATAVTV